MATHSDAHAGCPSTRNLTDCQLAMIRASAGMVAINLATVFLRDGGRLSAGMGWAPLLRHLGHPVAHLGDDHVGFGSDFGGAKMPQGIGDVTGLPALQAAPAAHGAGPDLMMAKLCRDNWLGVLRRTRGARGPGRRCGRQTFRPVGIWAKCLLPRRRRGPRGASAPAARSGPQTCSSKRFEPTAFVEKA